MKYCLKYMAGFFFQILVHMDIQGPPPWLDKRGRFADPPPPLFVHVATEWPLHKVTAANEYVVPEAYFIGAFNDVENLGLQILIWFSFSFQKDDIKIRFMLLRSW